MSTKVTLCHGSNYHLYQEIFDCGNVYLQVHGHEFEVSKDKVMIQIPIQAWNKIIEEWPKAKKRFVEQDTEEWVGSLESITPSDETIIFKKRDK